MSGPAGVPEREGLLTEQRVLELQALAQRGLLEKDERLEWTKKTLQLLTQVEQLTRERDESRADLAGCRSAAKKLKNERDELHEVAEDNEVLLERAEQAKQREQELRKALRGIIDCPDFSAKRGFTMKQLARRALAPKPLEPGER